MSGGNQKDFDFFRLDTDFFTNKKIKSLRRRFGSVGVLTYLYILSNAYGKNGYYIKIDNVDDFSYDVAENVANSNLSKVASVAADCIRYLAERGDISKELLDKGVISSVKIQRQYVKLCRIKRHKAEIKKEYRLIDTPSYPIAKNQVSMKISEEMQQKGEDNDIYAEEMQQKENKEKKEKEIKEKKEIKESKKVSKKEKENNITSCAYAHARESYDELFESFGVSAALKCALMDFIKHLLANGIVMINSRLEQIIIKLDRYFHDDADKIEEVQKAISGGYKKLSIE